MPDVNANDVATTAIQILQDSLDQLSAVKVKPGADIPGIDVRIGALEDRQDDLRIQALRTIQASDANKQAIAAVNAAAALSKSEAANVKVTAVGPQSGRRLHLAIGACFRSDGTAHGCVHIWTDRRAALRIGSCHARCRAATIMSIACACHRCTALWSAPSAAASRRQGNRCRSVIGCTRLRAPTMRRST